MSIFHRIPAAEVTRQFNRLGWLGFCPVWLSDRTDEVTERNWVPEWWMSVNIMLLDTIGLVRFLLGLKPWDGWPILDTGPIEAKP